MLLQPHSPIRVPSLSYILDVETQMLTPDERWLILLALSVLLSMRFSVWLGSAPSLASVCEESSCSLQRTRTVSAHHLTQDSTNATWGLAA